MPMPKASAIRKAKRTIAQRHRQRIDDLSCDVAAGDEGLAEVPAQDVAEPGGVLREERAVEAMRLLELRDLLDGRIGPEHDPGRGTRTGARQREERETDEEQRADRGDDAACDEAEHEPVVLEQVRSEITLVSSRTEAEIRDPFRSLSD
jgi:hypothetical protein